MAEDAHPEHWRDYTNLQHVKHKLIREYLNGWFPKLGLWSGRIYYFDTHAGRGKYESGEAGSPVVAIDTLLRHRFRDKILEKSEVRFLFIEEDAKNLEALRQEIAALGELPKRVHVHISRDDCFTQLNRILGSLLSRGQELPPAFVFVDPYGYKVPGDIIRQLLSAGRVEVFVNIMFRELDMTIAQARHEVEGGLAKSLNLVFAGNQWRAIENASSLDDRADQVIDLLQKSYGAKWATSIRMLGDNRTTRYLLAHFTNHEAGRDLMKDCVWTVCPDGGFYARRSDNPRQSMLIEIQPDLTTLDDWITQQLKRRPLRWATLSERIRGHLWRQAHLSQVIRKRRREGTIVASDFNGRFSERTNPFLALAKIGGNNHGGSESN